MRPKNQIGIRLVAGTLALLLSFSLQALAERPLQWAQALKVEGVPNLHKVSENLYRSAQPSSEGMKRLEEMGIKTVINLRYMHSDREELEGRSMKYVHIRFNPFDTDTHEVVEFLKIMNDPANHPVLVHCQHGSDRTGTVVALYRILFEGWSKDQALEEMTQGGYGFNTIWQNMLNFVRRLDMDQLREKAGLKPAGPPVQP